MTILIQALLTQTAVVTDVMGGFSQSSSQGHNF